jgi:glycosyltransferase involved in cell wall biosynthesis/MoaA/NifB/PqqE/SkfB family radical SAM enzyme
MCPVKILHVIHGYPPRYNAGSEVYTQSLCHAQAERHEVHVFTREEDPFAPECALRRERDRDDPTVTMHVVNVPHGRDRYRHHGVDRRFGEVLDGVAPDVVHVGHLNHLSTSLLDATAAREIPVVFTLHDFWLMCPRGQFMQMHPADPADLWPACDGQQDRKCAERCYARSFSGAADEWEEDAAHWTGWVSRRMRHVREMMERVDLFIAPSRSLLQRFRDGLGMDEERLAYLDYGFDLRRLAGRRRTPGEPFTFGYIGTHIPAKGVHHLIQAFGQVHGDARLRVWGRPRGQETEALRGMAERLPGGAGARVQWMGEYRNQDIVREVFDRVDAIVVPSVWAENSPLVIHEAQQARVPVIAADAGGMAELVHHGLNGLLFAQRDPGALAGQMQRLADDPALAVRLGARGYLGREGGDVVCVREHAERIQALYAGVMERRDAARVAPLPAPWRITLDTNPDTCNLRCIMCEEHSPHSTLQRERRAAGRPRRVMPLETVRRVITEAAGRGLREVIPSTMGEPLLYEHFDAILDLCREHGVMLNLTTNGTFPGRGARAWAERIVPVTSDIKVSWNGATRQTHERVMLGTRWDRVLENVRTLVEVRDAHAAGGGNRCRVTFQLTFLESNLRELADIVRLAAALGVDRVKGHHLWAHFHEIQPLSMRRDPDARRRWNDAVAEAHAAAAETRLPSGEHVLLENFFPLDEPGPARAAAEGPCPFLGREAWVSAEGRFNPCCAPDALRRTLGDFGDLGAQPLHEIWDGAAYQALVRGYRTRTLCRGCTMRRPAGAEA